MKPSICGIYFGNAMWIVFMPIFKAWRVLHGMKLFHLLFRERFHDILIFLAVDLGSHYIVANVASSITSLGVMGTLLKIIKSKVMVPYPLCDLGSFPFCHLVGCCG